MAVITHKIDVTTRSLWESIGRIGKGDCSFVWGTAYGNTPIESLERLRKEAKRISLEFEIIEMDIDRSIEHYKEEGWE